MIEAKLVVVGGETKTKEVNLRLPTVIGRGREVSLTLPHPLVSRRHCEIYERDGKLVVKDLGSLNGTFVNNKRIDGEEVLEPEQLLTLGTVTFRAVYASLPIASAPTDSQGTSQGTETVGPNTSTVTESVELEPAPTQASVDPNLSDKETVYDNEKRSTDTDNLDSVVEAIDADKIEPIADSQVVVGSPSEIASTDKPVSLSALDGLQQQAAVKIADSFALENEQDSPKQDSGGLDSFLRKLPR